jgi:hypothetical protein
LSAGDIEYSIFGNDPASLPRLGFSIENRSVFRLCFPGPFGVHDMIVVISPNGTEGMTRAMVDAAYSI